MKKKPAEQPQTNNPKSKLVLCPEDDFKVHQLIIRWAKREHGYGPNAGESKHKFLPGAEMSQEDIRISHLALVRLDEMEAENDAKLADK